MDKEIEVDFLEPMLSIMIANLEIIETEFVEQHLDLQGLSSLLDHLNDVEDLVVLRQLFTQINTIKPALQEMISSGADTNRFQLICALKTVEQVIKYLDEHEFLFAHLPAIEQLVSQRVINNFQGVFDNYQSLILTQLHQLYTQFMLVNHDQEMHKVAKILCNENDIVELKEGNEILLSFFATHNDGVVLWQAKDLTILMQCDVLISLLALWSEFGIEA